MMDHPTDIRSAKAPDIEGMYFIVPDPSSPSDGFVTQGRFARELTDGRYLVEIHDWLGGRVLYHAVTSIEEVHRTGWRLFRDAAERQQAVSHWLYRQEHSGRQVRGTARRRSGGAASA